VKPAKKAATVPRLRAVPEPSTSLTPDDLRGGFIDVEGLRLEAAECVDEAYAQLRVALAWMRGPRPRVRANAVRRAVGYLIQARDTMECLRRDTASEVEWLALRVSGLSPEAAGAVLAEEKPSKRKAGAA
jgi:hypothetical protein